MRKILRVHMVWGDAISKLETFVWIWNHVSRSITQLNNTKLGQMTNLNMIFYMVVSIYKLDQICNSPQSPARF